MNSHATSMFPTTIALGAILCLGGAALAQVAPSTPNGAKAPASSPVAAPQTVPVEPAPNEVNELPALPATPAPISSIIAARPFTVEIPWATDWREDRAFVSEGWIVLLSVPHDFVVPRQTQEPILFAGGTTVERLGNFIEEGVILAIVPATPRTSAAPGHAAETAEGMRPLSQLAFWYGTPGLPEQVDVATLASEIASAEVAKIGARPASEIARALQRGGAAVTAADRAELLSIAASMGPRPSATVVIE